MNANGHALTVWNATGDARFAERIKGGAWQASRPVPGAVTSAGPVATAIGDNEVAAIAYTTVATRYVRSKLMVVVRVPGGAGTFGAPVEPVLGAIAGDMRLGIACDGSVTLLWSNADGISVSTLPGAGSSAPSACDGVPTAGPWGPVTQLSGAGAALADLAANGAGAALAVWQEGSAPGNPTAIAAAYRPVGQAWESAQTVSVADGLPTWNPKPALDANGDAAVAYVAGNSMMVATRADSGTWNMPAKLSGSQLVYAPALATSASGDLVASWLSLDASNSGSVWVSLAPKGSAWGLPTRLSARAESADVPNAAFAPDGSVAIVGWTDNNTNMAKAAVLNAGAWSRSNLGTGYWAGMVYVAAGNGAGLAGWTQPNLSNPNAGKIVARTWQ